MEKKTENSAKIKILLVQLRQLGDILLTTPVIPALMDLQTALQENSLQKGLKLEISFLCHRMGNLILENFPDLTKIWTYHETDSLRTQWNLIRDLRHESFDIVVDFMNNPRSALYTFLSAGRHRLGFRSSRSWAYHQALERSKSHTYIVSEKLRFLNEIKERLVATFPHLQPLDKRLTSEPQKYPLPLVPFDSKDAQKARRFFASLGPDRNLRIVVSPTHRHLVRKWPPEHFAHLADWLQGEGSERAKNAGLSGTKVYWIWGPGEEGVIDQCMSYCVSPTLKLPPTTFREMAAFIANTDLFIGNSNGPSHVAVSVQTPSLQIHGPTDGRSWCPPDVIHQFIQGNSIASVQVEDVKTHIKNLFQACMTHGHKRLTGGFVDSSHQYYFPSSL